MKNRTQWQQIEAIFHAAAERPANERAAYLAEACGTDEELRREVESLLAYEGETRGFLNDKALNVAARQVAAEALPAGMLVGQQISGYQVLAPLGKGGMGEVYRARDTRLQREVALKVLPDDLANDAERLKRFAQEARAVSALNHPNVLTIYEFGEATTPTGITHFLAAELIDGETLRERLQRQPLALHEVLELTKQITQALVAAHAAQIIHRDIKPENVMIRRDGLVKVLDFGLAKRSADRHVGQAAAREQAGTDGSQLTAPGTVMGTVAYLSPEQARGQAVDERSDLFSLGVVLYEMLAQRLPFTGATASHVIVAILEQPPPPLPPQTPRALASLLDRLLAKRPADRPASAAALLNDLKELQKRYEADATDDALRPALAASLAPHPVTALPTPDAASKLARRKRWLGGGLSLLIALLVAGVFGYRASTRRPPIESIAVMPFVNTSGAAEIEYLADGLTETLIRNLSELPNVSVKARSSVFRYKGKDVTPKTIGQELKAQALLNGRVVQREGQLALNLELIDAQTENVIWTSHYERSNADATALPSTIARDVASQLQAKLSGAEVAKVTAIYTVNPDAWQLYLKGRYALNKGNAAGQKESVGYFRQAVTHDPQFALGYTGLADAYTLLGTVYNVQMEPAEAMRNARIACEKAIALNPQLSEAWTSLAWIKFRFDWDWAGAEADFKQAIALDPKSSHAHHWYAEFLSCMGQHDEATREMKIACELEPFSLMLAWNLGKNLVNARRFDEALVECQRVLALDPNFGRVFRILRHIYTRKGDKAAAFAALAREWEFNQATPAQIALLNQTYQKLGFQSALQLRAELDLQNAEKNRVTAYNRAQFYLMLKNWGKALDWLEQGYLDRNGSMVGIYTDISYEPLQHEPRYQALIQKMKFPDDATPRGVK